jgi:ankyrin repeat protein
MVIRRMLRLFRAVRIDDLSRIRRLLESGANVNAVDDNGRTLLHVAVESRPS